MAAISTIIAGVGLAIAGAGAFWQYEAGQDAAQASKDAEKAREKQAGLEAVRKRREVIRQMILARAAGTANAANQGASLGDSAVLGAQSQQIGSAVSNVNAIEQSSAIGSEIFSANSRYAEAQAQGAWGQSVSGIGMGMVQNSKTISRVGASYGLWGAEGE